MTFHDSHAMLQGATVRNEGENVIIGRIVKGGTAEKSGKAFYLTGVRARLVSYILILT